VHVTGGPGSGKTRLAQQLGTVLDAPVYDLDQIGWQAGRYVERLVEVRLAAARRIAPQPTWVTEGTMLGWTDALLGSADLIVWLDVPWRVAVWRILGRHVRASVAGANRHPGLGRLVRFVWYTRGYYWSGAPPVPIPPDGEGRATRCETAYRLAPHARITVRCRAQADLRVLLDGLRTPLNGSARATPPASKLPL
jgi:hypothetical protein